MGGPRQAISADVKSAFLATKRLDERYRLTTASHVYDWTERSWHAHKRWPSRALAGTALHSRHSAGKTHRAFPGLRGHCAGLMYPVKREQGSDCCSKAEELTANPSILVDCS